jgi:hypothetical protein
MGYCIDQRPESIKERLEFLPLFKAGFELRQTRLRSASKLASLLR